MQQRRIECALEVLMSAAAPATIVHFQEPWPEPLEAALKHAHPETPPPISAAMGRYIGKFLMGIRRSR